MGRSITTALVIVLVLALMFLAFGLGRVYQIARFEQCIKLGDCF